MTFDIEKELGYLKQNGIVASKHNEEKASSTEKRLANKLWKCSENRCNRTKLRWTNLLIFSVGTIMQESTTLLQKKN